MKLFFFNKIFYQKSANLKTLLPYGQVQALIFNLGIPQSWPGDTRAYHQDAKTQKVLKIPLEYLNMNHIQPILYIFLINYSNYMLLQILVSFRNQM